MHLARAGVAAAALVAFGVTPRVARAQEEDLAARVLARSHVTAELETGIIALPNAPISAAHEGGSTPFGALGKGDATVLVGGHIVYRFAHDFAFGAGFLLGPKPTADSETINGIPRTHSRSYMVVGAEGRYVPIHYKWAEAWLGLSAGGVIVADRFDTNTAQNVPPVIGTNEVTIRTEGFSIGVEAGLSWLFAERIELGFAGRADRWVLPNSQACSPLGDCATLTGSVAAFQLGLTLGYRLTL
jgi:hypothetical protein